ncbi:MAG: hypothetical protein AB7V40_00765 [Methyloceanibacter sp.]
MMTLAFALPALGLFLLWRRKARWSWALVVASLILGIVIFIGDVDFAQELGIRL